MTEKTISGEEIQTKFEGPVGFTLVDARPREEYDKEHIRRAMSLPLNDIDHKAQHVFYEKELLIIYAENADSPQTREAAEKLRGMNFLQVLEYPGGLKEWKEKGFPTEGDKHGI